ncbi:MAG: DUF192 domain-containing protein [Pseudomonadota bacterium]
MITGLNFSRRMVGAAVVLVAMSGAACAQQGPQSGLPEMTVTAGDCRLVLEKATTPEASQIGLMNRPSMAADRGMVFAIPKGRKAVFWMKNTLIPLDIAFLSEEWRVLAIKQMQPLDLTNVPGPDGTRIAVEVNEGRFAECGVAVGDQITAAE